VWRGVALMMMVSIIAISLAPSVQAAPLFFFANGGHLGKGAGQKFGLLNHNAPHDGTHHKSKKINALTTAGTVD